MHMKLFLFLLSLFFLFQTPVFATKTATQEAHSIPPQTIYQFRQTPKIQLQQRLKTFRNRVKAERVNRINSILITVNTNKTAALLSQLAVMQSIIERLQTKIIDIQKNGKDISTLQSALETAKNDISYAKTAVQLQKEKDYTLSISSEATAKNDIQTIRNGLQSDLEAMQKVVQNAKQALIHAITETKLLIGEVENGK